MTSRKNVVLVTGSNGHVGATVARRLARRYSVIGFDAPDAAVARVPIERIDVELASYDSLYEGLQLLRERHGSHIASVVHAATHREVMGERSNFGPFDARRSTSSLLHALQDFRVDQFVILSTVLVHLPCNPGNVIREDSPVKPRWTNPASFAETEELVRLHRGPIPSVALRIGRLYDDRGHSIPLTHQIQRIYERRLTGHVYPGNPDHGQAYVHLEDLVDAIQRCVERRSELPDQLELLIGEPESVSYDEIQRTIGRLIHHEVWETYQVPKRCVTIAAWIQAHVLRRSETILNEFMLDWADDHYALDIGRSARLLGWRPVHRLRDTIPLILEALCSNPPRWYATNRLHSSRPLASSG